MSLEQGYQTEERRRENNALWDVIRSIGQAVAVLDTKGETYVTRELMTTHLGKIDVEMQLLNQKIDQVIAAQKLLANKEEKREKEKDDGIHRRLEDTSTRGRVMFAGQCMLYLYAVLGIIHAFFPQVSLFPGK